MNVEYVSCKISAICRLNNNAKSYHEPLEPLWLYGTYSSNKNFISIYSKQDVANEHSNIAGIGKKSKYPVDSDVIQLANYRYGSSFVSLANSRILFADFTLDSGFNLLHQWFSPDTVDHQSTDMITNQAELVSCGLDGKLLFFDIETQLVRKSPPLTANSLHCIDRISENEMICGTTSGHAKLFDVRTQNVELNIVNDLSIITTVRRNSHIPHIVACGNDIGVLYLWDLRNPNYRPMQPVSVHTAQMNCLRYLKDDPNIILTSSLDGQLIKWNICNHFEISSVEAIIDSKKSYPINCFDVYQNQIVFADDNEVLYSTTF